MSSLTAEVEALRAKLDDAKARRVELQHSSRGATDSATELEAEAQSLKAALAGVQASIKSLATSAAESAALAAECRKQTAAMGQALEVECVAAADILSRQTDVGDLEPAKMDTVASINNARFDEFAELTKRLAAAREEERAALARIDELQDQTNQVLPAIERESEKFVAELTSSWQREKDELQAVYDKLMQVNREHQFHLQRGTHVKAAAAPVAKAVPESSSHEASLSARHAQLTTQLLEAQARLSDLENDNLFAKRSASNALVGGRKSQKEYEATKREAAGRLQRVVQERERAEEEKARFRDLRGELQLALQAIRECPSAAAIRR